MQKSLIKFSPLGILALATLVALYAYFVPLAQAHNDPGGCFSNGVGISIAVYRADGVTPVALGTVESGETINYEATLSHLGGSNCNFSGGTLTITTPDSAPHVVASPVPLVSSGSPFVAPQQSYVVSEADVAGGILVADVDYSGGESHTGDIHQNAAAGVDISTPFQDIALEVSKDAETEYTEEFEWTIEKTVIPDEWHLFDGDSGTSDYRITVTKSDPIQSGFAVHGMITIHNPAQFADAIIESVSDAVSGAGAMTVVCPEVFPFALGPGEDLVCTYSGALPDDADRINTATVATSGDVDGGEGSAAVDFSAAEVTTLNDEITVDDTVDAGDFGPVSATTTHEYSRTFACDEDEGTHDNIATIVETGQSDSASVLVMCHHLAVEKTAETSYDRTWEWTIDKSADQTDLNLAEGEVGTVNYTVDVDASSVDANHMVAGTIMISNDHPLWDADLTDVSDMIDGAIAATVVCPSAIVPAGGVLVCAYGPAAVGADASLNEAMAIQQNYDYDAQGVAVPDGTTEYNGSALIVFGDPANEIDECADVSDTNTGSLGTVCAGAAPATFNYAVTFGDPAIADVPLECGEHDHPNTADFITNDTAATGEDNWNVHIAIECPLGCTLTQGYWKTHSEDGPAAHPDATWMAAGSLLDPDGPDTMLFGTGMTWLETFNTPVKGNAYYNLAHQWMAAYLNMQSGASMPPEVADAIAHGQALLSSHTPDEIGALKGNNSLRQDFISTAGILGSYNEGVIGPGHCEE